MLLVFAKKHLSDITPYIILSLVIFFAAIYLGFAYAASSPGEVSQLIEKFVGMPGGSLDEVNSVQLFIFIFLRNFVSSFLAVAFGAILALLPIFSLLTNGAILGAVAYFFSRDISLAIIFFGGIQPHGILEHPAFFFYTASGIWLGVAAVRYVALRERKVGEKFVQAFKFYFAVVVPLLILAAFIESFITPRILSALIK